jgi:predicted N-acyltransferase
MTETGSTTPDDIDVQVVDGADEIADDEWDRVGAGCGLYTSRPWLRSLEDDPWHDVWYLTARSGGELLGLLPLYLSSGLASAGSDAYYDPSAVLAGAPLGDPARWSPALLAGSRTGYEGGMLLWPGLTAARRAAVLGALADRLRRLAEAWQVRLSAFMHLTPAAAAELAPVLGTRPLLTEATAVMCLAGVDSFEGFVAALPKRRRARVRAEVREFGGSDLRIRETRLSGAVDVVARLLAAHHHRYGHHDTPQMLGVHFRQQAAHLDEQSRVLLCERDGEALGALLVYEWGDSWYVRAVAADESLRGHPSAFFNLLYYVPLRMAFERGVRRYVIGPSTLAAKVWRGARVEPRWSLLVGADGLEADVARLGDGWNDARLGRWAAELGEIGAEVDVAAWRDDVGLPPA